MLLRTLFALILTLSVLAPCGTPAEDALPPAAEWISPDAVVVLEVSDPKAAMELALHPKLIEAVERSPAYQKQKANSEFRQLLNLVEYLEAKFDTDWKTILGKLTGGGVTWALGPGETSMLIVDAEDNKMLAELHDVFRLFAKADAEKQGKPGRVASAEYRGVTGWTFGPNEAHAIIGNRLLLTNRPEALKTALDLRADPDRPGIAGSAAYRAARQAAGTDSAAALYVNMEVLKHVPGVKKTLDQKTNPLAVLLLAGVTESLQGATWLSVGADVRNEAFVLRLATDGAAGGADSAAGFALPGQEGQGAMPNLAVPRKIAAASFYRDLHGFYAAKDRLFPERTSGLIFFENMMGIFFTGRDLTEEVLAETESEVRLVVAGQQYDREVGTPAIQVPAFAAVFRLKKPEKFSRVIEEAWQKAIGLVNFTRGQQALPGLIIDRPTHGDLKFTMAAFAPPEGEDRSDVDIRFNYQPSLAISGEHLILSSTCALTRDLIDALGAEASRGAKPLPKTHSLVEIDGVGLASILAANREALVRNNMVEEGNTRDQAETHIDLILMVLRRISRAKLDVGGSAGRTAATLELRLNLP